MNVLATAMKKTLRPAVQRARRLMWHARVHAYARGGTLVRSRSRQERGVRILTYHGICRDGEERLPWIPPYFVTQSLLDQQMTWLRSAGEIVSLMEAFDRLKRPTSAGSLVYAVTFDDGYVNNLTLAQPVLVGHQAPATFFLTTGPIETGGIVPVWMRARLLICLGSSERLSFLDESEKQTLCKAAHRWNSRPGHDLINTIDQLWQTASHSIDRDALEGVRFMKPEEVRELVAHGFELGAHTVSHLILSHLEPARRREEIVRSVESVCALVGAPARDIAFAYPNGKPRDFGQFDIDVLRELGVIGAVTTTPGVNFPSEEFDAFRLHRLPVSRRKTRDDFLAMLSGLYDHNSLWQPPD